MKTKEFFSINLKLIILLGLISFDFSSFLKLIYDKKNNINELNQKISKIKEMSLENKSLDNLKIEEVERKNNIHSHDIVVIKPSEEGFILTGSNDRTVKIWK